MRPRPRNAALTAPHEQGLDEEDSIFNRANTKTPVASMSLPPHPPKGDLTKAIANFERVADSWAEVRGEISDAKEAAEQAKAKAKAEIVEAAKSGKQTDVSIPAIEAEHAEKLAELEAREQALRVAVDETGNEMALQIAEHRTEWLAGLEEVAGEAGAKYAKGISEALAALDELGAARGAASWLTDFNFTLARLGQQSQFAGGRVVLRHKFPGTYETEWNPKDLLAAAAKVVDPAPAPQPVKSRGVPA
jgi:hypothetical protein